MKSMKYCDTASPTPIPTPTPIRALINRFRKSTKCSKKDMRPPASSSGRTGEMGSGWAGAAIAHGLRFGLVRFGLRCFGLDVLDVLRRVSG
jgi:hypothetical protein